MLYYLWSASDCLGPVVALAPSVARGVGPLDDTLAAGHPLGQAHRVAEVGCLGSADGHVVLGLRRVVGHGQRVGVHALLGGDLAVVVEGAQLQLEVAPVVRRQLNVNLDVLKDETFPFQN